MRGLTALPAAALALLLLAAPPPGEAAAPAPVHHELTVTLQPDRHRLVVEDRVTLPARSGDKRSFLLHSGLEARAATPGALLVDNGPHPQRENARSYRVTLPPGARQLALTYRGRIHHPLEPAGRETARGFRQTPGAISGEGVFLAGSAFWVPRFGQGFVTATLEVRLPAGWDAVSQGERTLHERTPEGTRVRWELREPQQEVFLVAGRFTEYVRPGPGVTAMVFLRSPDEPLADKYLEATGRYVALYEALIGPYPYGKFALVENFWETGLGMPSFTLLGPKVIRFPFIIHTSYPHEILHNWWGNSVYPEEGSGNWSEGLTAYLADHLLREQRGRAVEHRREVLQKYADYVTAGRDFPLSAFRARHGAASEAVGYGKSLMLFHMLRLELGDESFVAGLREFYQRHRFAVASFADLRTSLEAASGKPLQEPFRQWVQRPGAPALRVSGVNAREDADGWVLSARLDQVQPGPAYHLRIPLAVTLAGEPAAFQTTAVMGRRRLALSLRVPARPLRLDVDPEFDVFRRLHRAETPPAISQVLGAKAMLVVLPSASPALEAYRGMARALRRAGPERTEIRLDTEIEALPVDRSVTLLGWENRHLAAMAAALSPYDVAPEASAVRIGEERVPRSGHSVVLTARHPEHADAAVMWVAAQPPRALPGLARKLPHYHKYSYLAFAGAEPENTAKGRWPVLDSPMTVFLPEKGAGDARVERGALAEREPLARLPAAFSAERMMDTVRHLARDALQGRGFGSAGLDRAAAHIARRFREAGLAPAGDAPGSYYQVWRDRGSDPEREVTLKNVVGVLPGSNPRFNGKSVVVGAHYDHLGRGWPDARTAHEGQLHPGADDNASGVAVLIELARVLAEGPAPERPVVFVAFTAEEAGRRGSIHYVRHQRRFPAAEAIAMLNLDTVGRLGRDGLLVLGAGSAQEWAHILRGAGYVTGVDIRLVPEMLDTSDQVSFHEAGVPAVQLFTGPHPDYHRPGDTADKVRPDGLVRVAQVAREAVAYLAGREAPLASTLDERRTVAPRERQTRKVSLGTVPDFAYTGRGYRLDGVVPGSPAEAAGLREGDVITRVGPHRVEGLRDLSRALKALSPGDAVTITFLRDGEEASLETLVEAR